MIGVMVMGLLYLVLDSYIEVTFLGAVIVGALLWRFQ